jgi:hypothetical protein
MSSLIFNHVTSRVGRAGGANLALPVFAILLVLLVQAFSLPTVKAVLFGAFLVCCLFVGVRSYVTTLARIDFLERRHSGGVFCSRLKVPRRHSGRCRTACFARPGKQTSLHAWGTPRRLIFVIVC